ncbi:MAG: thioredoxin domain-containing protein [Bacteroidetes bacterium]|nr:thioredoxin domain-containing protein [Bacteroidota bacterium]
MFVSIYNNLTNTTVQLLKQLKIPYTVLAANKALQNHPNYPGLLSIADILKNNYTIDTAIIEVADEKLPETPLPFITLLPNKTKPFITVTNITTENIEYLNSKNKKVTIPKEDFLKLWNKTVLIAEKAEYSTEADFEKNKLQEKINKLKTPALLLLGVFIVASAVIANTALPYNRLGWICLTGIFLLIGTLISCLLLWYEIDNNNPVLQNICTGIAKTNCNAVLNSKASKLLGKLSWSEIGFFYFAGSFLFFTIAVFTNIQLLYSVLFWLNLLALPYTLFSVYYQWQVAKQWCVLCMAVQALLVLQLANNIVVGKVAGFPIFQFPTINFLLAIPCFIIPILGWYLLKPAFLELQEAKRKKRQLLRLKYDTSIFEALLTKQKQVTVQPTGLGITLGNPAATHTIIKVCNPYCGPCAKAHPEIEKLIENNEHIKAQIIFYIPGKNNREFKEIIVKHLLAIAAKEDAALISKALDDWYLADTKDYDAFAAKYPMNGALKQQNDKLEAMDKWCKTTDITFTPTFFINGKQLPDIYNIKDLSYFLSE